MERLLSVKDLAVVIGLRPAPISGLVERGEIPVQRVRRRVMFTPSAIEAWLARQAHPDRVAPEISSAAERQQHSLREGRTP